MKTAFLTGITGQDGSFLAELLLAKGYQVHGLVRRASTFNRARIDSLPPASRERLFLHYGELNDPTSLRRLLKKTRPDEVYHLAGQSHVGLSFEIPEVTCHENAMATLGLLEALRDVDHPVRVFHASSAEVFGTPQVSPQDEQSPFGPTNPYGVAKAFATQMLRVYRQAYGLFACNGILYNHESPRRGENFVTRKITMAAVGIKLGTQELLQLGNLDSRRDWGYAGEYVEGMWLTLQATEPADYVFASGQTISVRDFVESAFSEVGIALRFEGQGLHEIGYRADTGAAVIKIDPRFYRSIDSAMLVGNSAKAAATLGWKPKIFGTEVARLMVRAELAAKS
jgi:GDPmannose 4,6-dehydratase